MTQKLGAALLPLGATFWFYQRVFAFPQPKIYFTYTDALFFVGDAFALLTVLPAIILRIPRRVRPCSPRQRARRAAFANSTGWLIALCVLASLSVLWSLDWRTSLYISLHFWLGLGVYFVMRTSPALWKWFAAGALVVLVVQVFFGVWQSAAQSTAIAAVIGMDWPRVLTADISGVSVVTAADGARWLRAYGTLPHPNLLGGFVLVLMSAPLAVFFKGKRWHALPLIVIILSIVLLTLSFSRSSWVGLLVAGGVLLWHRKKLRGSRLVLLGAATLITGALLAFALSPLLVARLGLVAKPETEQVSDYTRDWLVARSYELIAQNPFGVGAGSYQLALARVVDPIYEIEPVHNVLLLVTTELGAAGFVLLVGLGVAIVRQVARADTPLTIVFSAIVLGALAMSFFDHYFWTLAPGRLLFFALLGLWDGAGE